MDRRIVNPLFGSVAILAILCITGLAQSAVYDTEPNWISNYEEFTTSVALAYVNDDEYLDLIVACYDYPYRFNESNPSQMIETQGVIGEQWGDYVYYYLGSDNGISSNRTQISVAGPLGNECISVCDYDNDGDMDIAVGTVFLGKANLTNDGKDYVLKNNGSGSFTRISLNESDVDCKDTRAVRWADLDCDGYAELITLGYGGLVHIYANNNGTLATTSTATYDFSGGDPTISYGVSSKTGTDQGAVIVLESVMLSTVGKTFEFGDIDHDGDLDMFIDYHKQPVVLLNTMEPDDTPGSVTLPNIFDPDDRDYRIEYDPEANGCDDYKIVGGEVCYSASFGFYKGQGYDADDSLMIAIGSYVYVTPCTTMGAQSQKIGFDIRGCNVYGVYTDESNNKMLRHDWASDYQDYTWNGHSSTNGPIEQDFFQMVTDIQWAFLDDDDKMDLVTCAYPTASGVNAQGEIVWTSGHGRERYYLANDDPDGKTLPYGSSTSSPAHDWQSSGNDLSTSLALGDIDTTLATYVEDTVRVHNNDPRRLLYVHRFPFAKLVSVEFRDEYNQNIEMEQWPEYTYDNQNGWVSIQRGLEPVTWEYLVVTYDYSTELDLAIGNDGADVVYYYDDFTATTASNSRDYEIDEYEGSPAHHYEEGNNITDPQMDQDAPLGFQLAGYGEALARELAQNYPNLKSWATTCADGGPNQLHWRHFYWKWLDDVVNVAADCSKTMIVGDYSSAAVWSMGNWDPEEYFHDIDFEYDKLHAYYAANLINRYRPDGILSETSGWQDDWGVEIYCFLNEPNLAYLKAASPANNPSSDHDYMIEIAEQMYRNYQMVHGISENVASANLLMTSPNFCNPWGENNVARPDMDFLLALNGVTTPNDALVNYCDIICHQMYIWDDTVEPPIADGDDDFIDPFEKPDYVRNHILDFYKPVTGGPVLEYEEEKLHMVLEWEFQPDAEGDNKTLSFNAVLFDTRNKQADNSSEQPLCKFSLRSSYYWGAGYTEQSTHRALDAQAALLNGTQPYTVHNGGSGEYDRSYYILTDQNYPSPSYQDPWNIEGENEAYDFVFFGEGDPETTNDDRYVHCVRSVDIGPEADENLYLEFDLEEDGRVEIWDGNGFFVDRETDSAHDNVVIHAGESDSMMLMIEENSIMEADMNQGIQLFKGWNLVSFNIKDDPNPQNAYFISEIFGGPPLQPYGEGYPWFAYEYTQGGGPDRVGVYNWPPLVMYFPKIQEEWPYENSWSWLWDMQWAYPVVLDEQHLIELSAEAWESNTSMDIDPSDAWDDSLDEILWPDNYAEYWFFLGFHLSRQVEVLPANEADGPFYDLYDVNGTNYGNQSLKVVKADDGRVFLPNYHGTDDYDGIGYLEPGRGYALGFRDPGVVDDWPAFSDPVHYPSEEGFVSPGKSAAPQISSVTSTHFTFKSRTHFFYPILIDTVAIDSITLAECDELAAFCGEQCVGATVYEGELPLVIPAWKDDIITPDSVDGYSSGQEITLKLYDASENAEITFQLPPGTYSSTPDDQDAPDHSGYGVGFFARRSLIYGLQSVNQLPQEYKLNQNYPNPFNAETIIPIELPQRSKLRVELYNVRGQNLGVIYEEIQNAGIARIHYNGTKLPSGVYFLKVSGTGLERGGAFSDMGKMLVLK